MWVGDRGGLSGIVMGVVSWEGRMGGWVGNSNCAVVHSSYEEAWKSPSKPGFSEFRI